jgi:hypothetical protein
MIPSSRSALGSEWDLDWGWGRGGGRGFKQFASKEIRESWKIHWFNFQGSFYKISGALELKGPGRLQVAGIVCGVSHCVLDTVLILSHVTSLNTHNTPVKLML